ncbi:MAG: hypothetical protein L0211_23585 [Planctomycetaceae bacterium]|nr:hypothetical protein [Planctomycetaceae bacterium]
MDFELIIPTAVAIVAIGLYVLALWIGDHKTISGLASASNLALALAVVAIGLATGLGLRLTFGMLVNPGNWWRAIGKLIEQI